MKYKIYNMYSANTELLPPDARKDIIHPLSSVILIEIGFRDRENMFNTLEDAMRCIRDYPEFAALKLTILPYIDVSNPFNFPE